MECFLQCSITRNFCNFLIDLQEHDNHAVPQRQGVTNGTKNWLQYTTFNKRFCNTVRYKYGFVEIENGSMFPGFLCCYLLIPWKLRPAKLAKTFVKGVFFLNLKSMKT